MQNIIITIAALVLVGCATTQQPEPPTANAPDISIHFAVIGGDIKAVRHHLTAGTDVNVKMDGEITPFHCAVDRGHKEITELLIANGANVHAKMERGETPLDWAMGGDET